MASPNARAELECLTCGATGTVLTHDINCRSSANDVVIRAAPSSWVTLPTREYVALLKAVEDVLDWVDEYPERRANFPWRDTLYLAYDASPGDGDGDGLADQFTSDPRGGK